MCEVVVVGVFVAPGHVLRVFGFMQTPPRREDWPHHIHYLDDEDKSRTV
jgi:hypothetical protein